MRAVPIALLLVITGGFAALGEDAPAKPAADAPLAEPAAKPKVRKKGPAASQLGSPKEDEGGAAGPAPSWTVIPDEPDAALIRGLLYAFEPAPEEIRIVAVEDLALLGDSRALNPLALLVFDPNLNVQMAALRTISHFQTPRAEEILENVVRHPRLPDVMKVKALQALPLQATATAREFVGQTAASSRVSASVRSAARLVLQDLQPPYAPSAPTASP